MSGTVRHMARIDRLLEVMHANPSDVRYRDLDTVCVHHFGTPRLRSGSHAVLKTPWRGDPRVNIQNDHGRAKPYQVRQVLRAVARLTELSRDQDTP